MKNIRMRVVLCSHVLLVLVEGGSEGLHRAGGLRGFIRNESCCETCTCPPRL